MVCELFLNKPIIKQTSKQTLLSGQVGRAPGVTSVALGHPVLRDPGVSQPWRCATNTASLSPIRPRCQVPWLCLSQLPPGQHPTLATLRQVPRFPPAPSLPVPAASGAFGAHTYKSPLGHCFSGVPNLGHRARLEEVPVSLLDATLLIGSGSHVLVNV